MEGRRGPRRSSSPPPRESSGCRRRLDAWARCRRRRRSRNLAERVRADGSRRRPHRHADRPDSVDSDPSKEFQPWSLWVRKISSRRRRREPWWSRFRKAVSVGDTGRCALDDDGKTGRIRRRCGRVSQAAVGQATAYPFRGRPGGLSPAQHRSNEIVIGGNILSGKISKVAGHSRGVRGKSMHSWGGYRGA